MKLGLKLGSYDNNYTDDILSFYQSGYFQYIELFAVPGSFHKTIDYWKQFTIPIVIHAPHSFAGMNISLQSDREKNKIILQETFKFADALDVEHIIFHSGVNGTITETITQLKPFIDSRCIIENKPLKGINGEKCIGATPDEIKYILGELQSGFCLDFGHAICTANSINKNLYDLINEFLAFNPIMYHLTDGDLSSETDLHLHYGHGTFPLAELIKLIPDGARITNEAKHDSDTNLNDFKEDYFYVKNL